MITFEARLLANLLAEMWTFFLKRLISCLEYQLASSSLCVLGLVTIMIDESENRTFFMGTRGVRGVLDFEYFIDLRGSVCMYSGSVLHSAWVAIILWIDELQ